MSMIKAICILFFAHLIEKCLPFQIISTKQRSTTVTGSVTKLGSSTIQITPFAEDEASINKASEFMLNSFWIPLSSTDETLSTPSSSDKAYSLLTKSVKEEFTARYGEIMGKRKLKSCLLSAVDSEALVGIVGIDVTLIDVKNQVQYTRNEAESTLTRAVSSLGPKERREYKNSSVGEIVDSLLPNLEVAVVLSNLAVDPNQRKKGIGFQLCQFVEKVVQEEMDVNQIFLRVESDNEAARKLYEEKLGYETAWVEDEAIVLRADLNSGEFLEIAKTTVSLRKKL